MFKVVQASLINWLVRASLIKHTQNFIWLMFLPKQLQELTTECNKDISLEHSNELAFGNQLGFKNQLGFGNQQICSPESVTVRADTLSQVNPTIRKLQQRMNEDLQREPQEEFGLTMTSCIINTETTWHK